jgi:hypothetical protein
MSDNVYLSADKTKVVPESALGKKWQVPRKVAAEMGLLDSPEKPVQERRTAPQKRRTAKPKDE